MAEMGSGLVVDNRLGQRCRLGMASSLIIPASTSNINRLQVALVATNALLSSQLILGIISATHEVST